ncbi:MAG: hypothetical protein D6B26_03200 [Spirochaetaceae bacterium]|nr:MAG: hypothetical protein D6B26_03200 [Spirochaetaceae bacterium]
MASHNLPSSDEKALIGHIKNLLQRIQYQEDPAEMDFLRRIYKKHVPIFRRSYFSALLLQELAKSNNLTMPAAFTGSLKKEKSRPEKIKKDKKAQREERKKDAPKSSRENRNIEAPCTTPAEGEDPNTLFISIGKNRRVFPRDLLGLISTISGVDTEKVGDIRILDNYSFVTVAEEIAPAIITALHGSEFRGRRITVNFARKKS